MNKKIKTLKMMFFTDKSHVVELRIRLLVYLKERNVVLCYA